MAGTIEQPLSEPAGRIIIAPQVLTTIVRQATLSTDGVQRLATRLPKRSRQPGRRASAPGIEVMVHQSQVQASLHIIAEPGANMFHLAETLQLEVARAIEHIVGLEVANVNVYIDDVAYPMVSKPAP